MTDTHLPADRRPEFAAFQTRATDDLRAESIPRVPRNPWLTGLLLTWGCSAILALVLVVSSASAGDPDTAIYPTWDFSTPAQTVLVIVAIVFALVSTAALFTYLGVRASHWVAPEPTHPEPTLES